MAETLATQMAAEAGSSSGSNPHQTRRLDAALFALSIAGIPIGIVAVRKLGRFGGLLMEAAIGVLGIRAVFMLGGGAARRLEVVPRVLLFLEIAADGLAAAIGFWAWVWRAFPRTALPVRAGNDQIGLQWLRRHAPQRQISDSWATPLAMAAWMAALSVHIARMAIYISPSRGLRSRYRFPSR